MNNTQDKSVSASSDKSKKSQRKRNKKSKNQIEFVAIPKQDLIWAKKQKPSVVTLWLECWECDPYGSRWMTLNHSLSESAFRKAKKLISSKGLFVFKPDRSIRDGRETVSWLVQNLHGSRRENFGISTDSDEPKNDSDEPKNNSNKSENDLYKPSISPESTQNQPIPAPSITPQKHLINSSKELNEVCEVEKEVSDRDRDFALEEQITSASPQSEKRGEQEKYPKHQAKSEAESSSDNPVSEPDNTSADVVQPSLKEYIEQARKEHPYMSEEVVYAVAQNLAIEAEQTSLEYQRSSRDALAQIKAFCEQKKEEKKRDREKRLRGDSY